MCFLVTIHFIKISNFLIFYNYFSFFIHNNHHLLSSFILRIRKEKIKKKRNLKKKTKCKINSIGVNLKVCYKFTRSLYGKPINLHGYIWINVAHFCAKLCKFYTFFYYTVIDVSALTMKKKKIPFLYLIYRLLMTFLFLYLQHQQHQICK